MIITNQEEALRPLRQAAREADTTGPVDRLSLVLNGVIPAVTKFCEEIGEDSEMALFIGDAFCWFFGNRTSIRAMIPDSQTSSEMTFYRAYDFGPITIARGVGKVSVRIAGVTGADSIELDASGGNTGALEAVIPFLFGRGGSQSTATRKG